MMVVDQECSISFGDIIGSLGHPDLVLVGVVRSDGTTCWLVFQHVRLALITPDIQLGISAASSTLKLFLSLCR